MRLFVALEFSESLQRRLSRFQQQLGGQLRGRVRGHDHGVRWIRAEQAHITLKFLGDVLHNDVVDVSNAVRKAASSSPAFSLSVEGCGCFPKRGPVRVIWVGTADPSGGLRRCFDQLESQVVELGYPPERRPFAAHITVGRVRADSSGGGLRSMVDAMNLSTVDQPMSHLTLMQSDLTPDGPIYVPICRAELAL